MQLDVGLNPYGLTWHLGILGRGKSRTNPDPAGLPGYLALAAELGSKSVELWDRWLLELDEAGLARLRQDLGARHMVPIVSSGLQDGDMPRLIRIATTLGAALIRVALTPILCGDRAAAGPRWYELVATVREKLGAAVPALEAAGVTLCIENHQDFTSRELVGLCEEFGPAVRIVYDTGNPLAVGEAPLDFTRVIAPYVRYMHLKDYRVHWTDEGIRLVRWTVGDGAVPFREVFAILAEHHQRMPAGLELAALEARHVRLFTPGWWRGYPPREAEGLAACLAAARVNRLPDDFDWRTPWERGDDAALEAYELDMIRRSAANIKALGE